MNKQLRTVLFDLDGTLADTAPDLAYALNQLLGEEGRPLLSLATIRCFVSQGTKGLLKLGFDIESDDPAFERLRERLLQIYRTHITRESRLFPGMAELLQTIEARGMNWGIVTNKPANLTEPLIQHLGLTQRAACIISGDTTPYCKPHPAPMLQACKLAGSQAYQCVYLGDAQCDIEAGRRAGMKTLVALFGYLSNQDEPHTWGADAMVTHPMAVMDWINAYETPNHQRAYL